MEEPYRIPLPPQKKEPPAPPQATLPPEPQPVKPTPSPKPPKQKKKLSRAEKRGAQMLAVLLIIGVLIYLVLVGIIALTTWYSFRKQPKNEDLYAVYFYSEGQTKSFLNRSAEEANTSYGLYLRYSDLSEHCKLGVAGDTASVTLFFPGAGKDETVVCKNNSAEVTVNGVPVRLSAPVLFDGEDYLLPVSLFETYIDGLELSYDTEKMRLSVTIPTQLRFSLRTHAPTPLSPIDEASLPEDPPESSEEPSDSSESSPEALE